MNPSRNPWPSFLAVSIVAALAAFLRVVIAGDELLWLDELHTSWVVGEGLGSVAGRAADGNQAPFYFWLTWFPVSILGASELWLRLTSVLAGVALLPAVSILVWRWTRSNIAAVVVAVLVATDIQFVYYATEARPYAWVQLLGALQVGCFWRFIAKSFPSMAGRESGADTEATTDVSGRRYMPHWGLVVSSVVLFSTHYTSVWLFVVELIFMPLVWFAFAREAGKSSRKTFLARSLSTAVVFSIASVPMMWQMFKVFQRRGNWVGVSSIEQTAAEQLIPFATWILFPLMCLVIGFLWCYKLPEKDRQPVNDDSAESENGWAVSSKAAFVFVSLWAVVPILCVMAMDHFGVAPMALSRYTLVGAAAFPVFAGLVIGVSKSMVVRLLIASCVLTVTAMSNPLVQHFVSYGELANLRAEDWKSVVDEIGLRDSKKNQPLFLFANLIEDVDAFENKDQQFQEYLLFPVQGLYSVDSSQRDLFACPTMPTTHFLNEQISKAKERGGAWVVVRAEPQLVQEVADEFQSRCKNLLGDDQPVISVMDSTQPAASSLQNPVYLLSIDW